MCQSCSVEVLPVADASSGIYHQFLDEGAWNFFLASRTEAVLSPNHFDCLLIDYRALSIHDCLIHFFSKEGEKFLDYF